MKKALPKRPYLLRAMHQWITECGHTPHVIVDAGRDGAEVPRAYVKDGKIVLNLSEAATQRLRLGNDAVEFDARFGGVKHHVRFPVSAVLGVYAQGDRRGHGVLRAGARTRAAAARRQSEEGTRRPQLKVVK